MASPEPYLIVSPITGVIIQAFTTALVGGAAAIVALFSIKANREIVRNRATFDYLERTESTLFYQEISGAFIKLKTGAVSVDMIADPTDPELKKLRQQIIQYLNHYETLSLAIQFGSLNEEIYFRAYRTALVTDWEAALPFVTHRRTQRIGTRAPNPKAFLELQWLAERWGPMETMPGIMEMRRNRLPTHFMRRR